MATAVFPIVIAIIGAAMYFISSNVRIQEVGRILIAAGMFALAFSLAGKALSL